MATHSTEITKKIASHNQTGTPSHVEAPSSFNDDTETDVMKTKPPALFDAIESS